MRLPTTFCALLMSSLFTAQASAAADVTLHGTLINLACKIGDDKAIDVDFGNEVVADLVDGIRYKKEIPVQIVCNESYSGDLNFKVVGTAGFEPAALKTDIDQLAIRFSEGATDTPIEINKAYQYKNNDTLTLKAVPVKETGAVFTGGKFNATAQLLVEPQ